MRNGKRSKQEEQEESRLTWSHTMHCEFGLPCQNSAELYMVQCPDGAPHTSQAFSHVGKLTLRLRKCLVRHLEDLLWRGVASPMGIGIHYFGRLQTISLDLKHHPSPTSDPLSDCVSCHRLLESRRLMQTSGKKALTNVSLHVKWPGEVLGYVL